MPRRTRAPAAAPPAASVAPATDADPGAGTADAEAQPAPNTEPRWQIGQVAAHTGLTPRTLRYYEQQGLMRPAHRKLTGYRRYSDLDVQRILLIRQFQQLLGLSLADIRHALAIDIDPDVEPDAPRTAARATDPDLATQRERTTAALAALDRDLAAVEQQRARLTRLRSDLATRADAARAQLERLDAAIADRERTVTRGRDATTPSDRED